MKTYLRGKSSIQAWSKELLQLYKFHINNQKEISHLIEHMGEMSAVIETQMGRPLKGKKVLEVGPGQMFPHLYFFARDNEYTGIDIDLPLQSIGAHSILKMWRSNGLGRTIKTIGRHMLGIDSAFKKEISRQLGITSLDSKLIQMDACQMSFEDESFDCAISISVFEHLPEPEKVMKEIARVLKPGGVAYIITHLYTSDTGIHDPKLYSDRDNIPYWSHLQLEHAHRVEANCYLNKIKLAEYERLFKNLWPGSTFEYFKNDEKADLALQELRSQEKLAEYSDIELMTNSLATVWRKKD